MTRRWSAGLAAAVLAVLGCNAATQWLAIEMPTSSDATILLSEGSTTALYHRLRPSGVPDISAPQHLRPCCPFGYDLKLRYAFLPILGYTLSNLRTTDEVGPHRYDSGAVTLGSRSEFVSEENNGLVFTCRGGFIDTAHVRDYADWTIYLGSRIFEQLGTGTTIQLPNEAGERRVVLEKVDPELLRRHDRVALTVALAQWLAVQLSTWHEVATWYGWGFLPGFSEKASAFSPEDLYSNVLGTHIAAATAIAGGVRTEVLYERSADAWLRAVIEALGPGSKETALETMRSLDGVWWSSVPRLPDAHVLLRRNIALGEIYRPWVIPQALASEKARNLVLRDCGGWPSAVALLSPASFDGTPLRALARLELRVDPSIASQPPFDSLGPKLTEEDFPRIVSVIRDQNAREFGPNADRPE